MGVLFWIAVLIFGIPALIGAIKGLMGGITDSDTPVNPIFAYIALAIGIIFLIIAIPHLSAGMFSSLKNFCLLIIKALIGFAFLITGIVKVVFVLDRKNWTSRVHNILNGSLGTKIKNYIPNNSLSYWVYDDGIVYLDRRDGQKYSVTFSNLGYENIPAMYTNIICEWLSKNLVKNHESYKMHRLYTEHDEWVSGTYDTIITTKTYNGYESHTVKGDDNYRTVDTTIGYQLVHTSLLEQYNSSKKSLNKW